MDFSKIEETACLQLIIATISIVGSVFAAWITVRLTVQNERKTLILTIKRDLYMDVYKHLSKLKKNPTLIYEQDFMDILYDLSIQVDVYASKNVKNHFEIFYNDSELKFSHFIDRFLEETVHEDRQAIADEIPLFSEQLDKEEEDYKIQNMCDMKLLEEMMCILKKELIGEK